MGGGGDLSQEIGHPNQALGKPSRMALDDVILPLLFLSPTVL